MLVLFFCVVISVLLIIHDRIKHRRLYELSRKFPGPFSIPIIGNSKDFSPNSHYCFMTVLRFSEKYGRFYRLWNNGKLFVLSKDYKDAEALLGSTIHIKKSESYRFIRPWIGESVLTATGPLWKKHRKIITPAFHFKILVDFLEVFNRKAQIFCDLLHEKVGKEAFDVHDPIKLLALDNIYESAMGINMDIQKNSDGEYTLAVKDMTNVISLRFFKVGLMIDALFKLSKYGKIQENALKVLHNTTEAVIKKKKLHESSRLVTSNNEDLENEENDDRHYKKKKKAFLDLLMESSEVSTLSDKEIREEVDTFLFAGHDTVSSGIAFTLYCLANNPEIQEKAYQEQLEMFGKSDRLPTFHEIQDMKYLEKVIKETQRLYPSVPVIGRELDEELELPGKVIVPKGTQFNIIIHGIHRDPRFWNNPNEFNPDNFEPEAIQSRPPYTYIPFSAGPRNCIGQKYAMLLMKSTLSIVLRKFKFLPSTLKKHKLLLAAEIVLVSKNGIHLQIESRS